MIRSIAGLAAIAFCVSAASAPALAMPLAVDAACEVSALACDAPTLPQDTQPQADEWGELTDPALIPAPFQSPTPEIAVFTVEEAAAPFLGPASGAGARVLIAIEAPGYSDIFTVYFPRGSAYLTLPAGDMVALAAEAVRDRPEAEVWVSAGSTLTSELGMGRMAAVQDILLQNDIPARWIHVDDGDIDAILNRPASLADDLEL